MSTRQFNQQLGNSKIFLIAFVFSLISGCQENLRLSFILFLADLGYTTSEIQFTLASWGIVVFFANSVLFFVLLYSVCKRDFIENIASIIVSLIVGTVVGYWIGGLLGYVSSRYFLTSPSILIFSNLLIEFAACSAAYINEKWRTLTPKTDAVHERPIGVVIICALYVVLGISLTILAGIVSWLSLLTSLEVLSSRFFVLSGLILLLAVTSLIYFIVAYGFYTRRKWAWLTIFASTWVGVFSSINQLAFETYFVWFVARILVLVLSVFILIYLLQPHVRIYFGIVNPWSENPSETS